MGAGKPISDVSARLSSALDRRDEQPNIDLAEAIVDAADTEAVDQLADILISGKKPARQDAIKTMYEIGTRNPAMITPHASLFLDLAQGSNNRMIWGAIMALYQIAELEPAFLTKNLGTILQAADASSVIAKDHAIKLILALTKQPGFHDEGIAIAISRMAVSAPNQFPTYAEQIFDAGIPGHAKADFCEILNQRRRNDLLTAAKHRRIEKLLKKLA